VVALPSLKRRRHPEISPPTVGIVASEMHDASTVLKRGSVGLDVGFKPIDPLTGIPLSGPVSLTNNGGSTASETPIQLIFWGSAWNEATTSPSAGEIISAVQSILVGPYLSALRQYGIKRSPLGGAIVVSDPGPPYPPETFTDENVGDLIWTLIDNDHFPEPDEAGGGNLYLVIMPPNTKYDSGGGIPANGAHSVAYDYDFPGGYTHAVIAWIGNSSIDGMTSTLSHELVEMYTDPDPDEPAWTVDGEPDQVNEIGDICTGLSLKLNGVLVQSYYSQFDNQCWIATSYSVRRILKWAGITLDGKGLRSLQSPIPSLKNLLASL
jgi:hypothetical protein